MEMLQLKYFRVVAQSMNLTRAAEQLYISQSSLSQTIHRLESELGYPLFDRKGKRIELNDNGKIFLKCVNQIDITLDSAKQELAESNNRIQQQMSIHIGCASLFLPELLTYLKKNNKDFKFFIMQWNHNVQDIDADLEIVAEKEPIVDNNSCLLLKERILLALPKEHLLNNKKDISISDLYEEEFISLNLEWSLSNTITEKCSAIGFEPNISIQVDNPTLMRNLLKNNLGIALIPEITWGNSFANGGLILHPIVDLPMQRFVYLKWKKSSYLTVGMRRCIPLIQEFFANKSNQAGNIL